MISQLSSAPPVTLSAEDERICRGRGPDSDVPSPEKDAAQVRAGFIYLMRKGDRRDYAKILSLVDGD